jgi:adenosylmethionine-8-amino-7-oxononanoate aminotransferase
MASKRIITLTTDFGTADGYVASMKGVILSASTDIRIVDVTHGVPPGDILTHPRGFLASLRELTRAHDVLLIADEVATGFGRTGAMFACGAEGVTPDLMCLAKGITGGYLPLAATLTSEEVFAAFLGSPAKTFFHGHTYTGNALACAAAIASLELFEANGILVAAPAKIERIAGHLASMRGLANVARTRQCGFMVGIDLAAPDGKPFDPALRTGSAVCAAARARGVIIRPLGDTVVLMPAPGMDAETLEELLTGVTDTIREYFEQ